MTQNNGTKKMLTGAAAIAAGAALLLGGGGTLAAWNDSAESAAGKIATGDLALTIPEEAETTWVLEGSRGKVIDDISTYQMVPGEQLTLSQDLDLKLAGTNLQAELAATFKGSLSEAVRPYVELSPVSLKHEADPLDATHLTSEDSGTVTASVTVSFLEDAPKSTANKTINLGMLDFQLSQK